MNSIIKTQSGIIRELLGATQDVGIIIGENQNIDSVGAALALYLILQIEGKNVQIVSKKDPTVEVSNLFGVNKITDSFEGSTKILTISVPYREGEIEKVSYNIEGNKLNVNLFAEQNGISFKESDVEYLKKGSSPSLIITIGVESEAELAGFVDPASVKTIHIDRSPLNSLMGDVSLIDPTFSSISEIVAEVVRELAFGVDVDAFQNLMDGIAHATRNFTTPATSAFAFEAAGFLMQNGAKRKEKNQDRASEQSSNRSPFDQNQGRPFGQDPFNQDPLAQLPRPNRPFDGAQNRQNRPPRPFDGTQGRRDRNFQIDDPFADPRPQPQPRNNQPVADRFARGQRNNQPRPNVQNRQPSNNQNSFQDAQSRSQLPSQPQPQQPQPPVQPKMTMPFDPQNTPKEMSGRDFPDDIAEPAYTEGSMPETIPDDWFLPKVFKGSKKGN